MTRVGKILFFFALIGCGSLTSFADGGGFSKKKKEVVSLNINTTRNFKSNLRLNLTSGLKYTGSLMINGTRNFSNPNYINSGMVFQKGNMVYLVPFKQQKITPEIKQGYNGVKIAIKVP